MVSRQQLYDLCAGAAEDEMSEGRAMHRDDDLSLAENGDLFGDRAATHADMFKAVIIKQGFNLIMVEKSPFWGIDAGNENTLGFDR